jgi:hypothetical protein
LKAERAFAKPVPDFAEYPGQPRSFIFQQLATALFSVK